MNRVALALAGAVLVVTIALAAAASPNATAPSWSAGGALVQARNYPRVTALPTGELLVTGGVDPAWPEVARSTSELFDPRTGHSTLLPAAMPGRVNHTATLGWGDRVVVAGGTEYYDGSWHAMDRVDVYLPYAREWLIGAAMPERRGDHAAAALRDGRVLVAGGEEGARILSTAELYDPATDRWSPAAPLPRPRTQFLMATLPSGLVLALGGLEGIGLPSATSLLYDPTRDRWTEGPALSTPRVLSALATLPSGDVLVVGGQRDASNSAERYDWRRNRFVYAGTLIEPRLAAVAAALPDGTVALAGGLPDLSTRHGFVPTTATERWDPTTNMWRELGDLSAARALGALVLGPGGAYLVGAALTDETADPQVERLSLP